MAKVVLTNDSALRTKYGERTSEIYSALETLIAADRERAIETNVIRLDSDAEMRPFGQPIEDASDERATKSAIDSIYRAVAPDYIMVLGAGDVIPFQTLDNPSPDDGDPSVPSDLPYASEGGWSKDARDFTAVTRVVGRVPDMLGMSDPAYLVSLLGFAANAKPLDRSEYQSYFGISASVWEASTNLSLTTIFGSAHDLQLSPPDGWQWPSGLVGRRAHFINCHGQQAQWRYFGQARGSRTLHIAHDSTYLPGKIATGTVVAAECCFGFDLYDPSIADAPSICTTYLGNGAVGFFGSSTIAWGGDIKCVFADQICQNFWKAVLDGSSLGAAVLRARQDYVKERPFLGPFDLKTLAQFNLLGDPSVHAVSVPGADEPMPHSIAAMAVLADAQTLAVTRGDRRRKLAISGLALAEATAIVGGESAKPEGRAREALMRLAGEAGLKEPKLRSYEVEEPHLAAAHSVPGAKHQRIHVALGRLDEGSDRPLFAAVVAQEENGEVTGYQLAYSH